MWVLHFRVSMGNFSVESIESGRWMDEREKGSASDRERERKKRREEKNRQKRYTLMHLVFSSLFFFFSALIIVTLVRGEDREIRNTRRSVHWQLSNRRPVASARSETHLGDELNQPWQNTWLAGQTSALPSKPLRVFVSERCRSIDRTSRKRKWNDRYLYTICMSMLCVRSMHHLVLFVWTENTSSTSYWCDPAHPRLALFRSLATLDPPMHSSLMNGDEWWS